jgi:hypothetical protein
MAQGKDTGDRPFELYRNTSFSLKPRVLYVYKDDRETAEGYEKLLVENGLAVDVVHVEDVPEAVLPLYDLVIVGPKTGNLDEWGTDAALNHIVQNERPVLGLGEGGYAFFGKLKLKIGWPNGAHGDGTSIIVQQYGDNIWRQPYDFDLRDVKLLQLYREDSPRVDILLGEELAGIDVFGLNDKSQIHANLLMESDWWMLWGFGDAPELMTQQGRDLFVNTVFRTMR